MGFVANFIRFPAVQKFWTSVKIWQSYRQLQGGNFFETQCICIFGGSCPWRNSARCKIHFTSKSSVLLFWERYCTALQQWALAKLQHGTRNGIMELLRRAPAVFSWAAITLGIGPPHSNYCLLCMYIPQFYLYPTFHGTSHVPFCH